jgi:hypothetical protein
VFVFNLLSTFWPWLFDFFIVEINLHANCSQFVTPIWIVLKWEREFLYPKNIAIYLRRNSKCYVWHLKVLDAFSTKNYAFKIHLRRCLLKCQ